MGNLRGNSAASPVFSSDVCGLETAHPHPLPRFKVIHDRNLRERDIWDTFLKLLSALRMFRNPRLYARMIVVCFDFCVLLHNNIQRIVQQSCQRRIVARILAQVQCRH